MKPRVEYLPDASVDDVTDEVLRTLLSACFTKPQDVVFKDRRYFHEPYPHRWIVRDGAAIVAHVGAHEKHFEFKGLSCRVGGIAEVCVHSNYRGRGYVRIMLPVVHEYLADHGFVFAVLFGEPGVYGSSGYKQVPNLFTGGEKEGWTQITGMVKELSTTPWPSGKVFMSGPEF